MASKHKLSFAFIRSASAGKYSDGAGLWLHKRDDGGSQWFLRISIGGKRREMGLGGYPEISIKQAREDAETFRSAARNGIDPIQHRDQQKRELLNSNNTLEKISYEAFEARKAELKEDGKAGRWFTPIKLHVLPKIGNIRIEEINQHNIKNALEPIWHSKADTARKAMNRLNLIFKYAVAMDLDVDINAVAKAKILLGKTRHKPVKIPALHWRDIPAFYETLEEITPVNLAMRLLILTGVRSKPLRHFRLEEIQDNIWVVPSANMKGRKDKVSDFRVPLSQEAKNVIELAMPFSRDGYLFPGIQKGVISDATMSRKMERRGMVERPHGFRSSLRTWLAECTDAPHEVCETILAHKSGTDVQMSYRRTDFLEQRKVLMERWAGYTLGETSGLTFLDKGGRQMKGRPPKLDLEKLKLNKENAGDNLEALKSRWEQYEDLRKNGEMPTSFIALEVMSVIAAAEEQGFSEEQIQSTFPKKWGAETINIPVNFLNVIRDCWWRYRDSETLLLGEAFGVENLNGQGSHPIKSKISTMDLHRKYAHNVIQKYFVPDQQGNPRALIDVYADVAADLGVSIDTVKAAYLKYSPKIKAGLKEKGIIPDD